jgi:hypothetical protein
MPLTRAPSCGGRSAALQLSHSSTVNSRSRASLLARSFRLYRRKQVNVLPSRAIARRVCACRHSRLAPIQCSAPGHHVCQGRTKEHAQVRHLDPPASARVRPSARASEPSPNRLAICGDCPNLMSATIALVLDVKPRRAKKRQIRLGIVRE